MKSMINVIGNTGELGKVEWVAKNHFTVTSFDKTRYSEGTKYHVIYNPHIKKFSCNCPAYLFNNPQMEPCKHALRVMGYIRQKKGEQNAR